MAAAVAEAVVEVGGKSVPLDADLVSRLAFIPSRPLPFLGFDHITSSLSLSSLSRARGGGDFRPKKSGINKKSLVAKLALVLGQKLSLLLIQPILLVVLRSIVRNRAFWQKGLESAWFNASKVTPEVIDGYRKGKLVRGWDVGMVKFVFAMLFSMNSKESASLLTQIVEAAESGLPVLVVHGEHDRIVPLANSLALEKVIPNCQLAILRGTGHNCHEEAPLEFIDIVADFLKTL